MRRLAAACFAVLAVFAVEAQVQPPANAQAAGIAQVLEGFGFAVHYDSASELAGVTTIEGLTVALRTPDGAPDKSNMLTIARIVATGLDIEAIRTVFDHTRYTGTPDQTFRTLASQLALHGVAFAAEGKALFTIDALALDGWEMKQFLWLVPGGPEFDRQFTTPLERMAKISGNIIDSLRLTSSAMTGIHAELDARFLLSMYGVPMAGMGAMDLGPTIYEYAEVSTSRVDRGAFGPMAMKGLVSTTPAMEGQSMRLTTDEVTIASIDISKVLPYLTRADWPPISEEGLLAYGAMCMRGYELVMEDSFTVHIPEICSPPVRFVWLIPERFGFGGKGTLTIDEKAHQAMPAHMAKYFAGPVDLSFDFAMSYDRAAGVGSLDHYGFALGGFGGFDLRARIGGLEIDRLAVLPSDYASQLTLTTGEIEIVDEGGIDAILDMVIGARLQGATGTPANRDEMRAQAKVGVDMMVGALGNTPAVAAMGKAIKDFIDQGGTLVLRVEPPKPLTLTDFDGLASRGAVEIGKMLGLFGAHTPP